MPLECDVIVDQDVEFDLMEPLAELLRHAAQSEPILAGADWQMTLRVSGDDTIAALHERFFADPTPTDVITFPSDEPAADDGAYLGDVVVSVETAAIQAHDAGHSREREVAFLALHGLLHLCGYDDESDDDRTAMHRRQSDLLTVWEREQGRPW